MDGNLAILEGNFDWVPRKFFFPAVHILPIFKFLSDVHWILQRCLFKFWNFKISCIKIWKLQICWSAAVHSTSNNSCFKFRLDDYFLLCHMINAAPCFFFALNDWAKKCAGNVNRPGLFFCHNHFQPPLFIISLWSCHLQDVQWIVQYLFDW